jgi:hypothetical protein
VTLANLKGMGIVRMSRADDLVSFVSPRLSQADCARGCHKARLALRKRPLSRAWMQSGLAAAAWTGGNQND